LGQLATDAPRLDFFQVVRRLEALYPEKPGFGHSQQPKDDPIRLGQTPSMAFAPGMLAGLETSPGGRQWLRGYFFGLFGPNGPLPHHVTEHALPRKDATLALAAFADLFHHRLLSLFYRAWASGRPTVSFDKPDRDRFGEQLGAQFGLGQGALRGRDELPDRAKLHYAGILSMQARNAEGLRVMLEDFFRATVEILEFRGGWMRLPDNCRLRLGQSPDTGGLGTTAVLGAKVWGCQQRFRIVIGPLALGEFRRLLPTGDSVRRLVALVRNYIGDEKDWDLGLILKKDEMPPLQLGRSGELGWTSWLQTTPADQDLDHLILRPITVH
jgi:type VI secretion system protein ImpH